ncbi:Pkinase-domain-containing protein [Russula earlei]|uniref:Pkinase-domain-containing protein n=1 Tax=Russula earlei TaxID=71964 RepID=A0ACC0ULF0_9AGAM|nr:Pkinase-domain-containing protein [Russula earlei]
MSQQHFQQGHSRPTTFPLPNEPFTAVAIPAFRITPVGVRYHDGDAQSSSVRSFTPIKTLGDGNFATVWLCDWHWPLFPNTPISAMQSNVGTRSHYAGKRLVAVKHMKKKWELGWEECRKLKELDALLGIPAHPNIIPLYDCFLLPETKQLYFVFEPMEGHLFQLIKTRHGRRPFAGGLVVSIFRQIAQGLHHVHASGYFHRDMKPENILVTTTGYHSYPNLSPTAPPDAPPEQDVKVLIKLADFGLAREIRSKPPYSEYISVRWYRAPEVLLKSRDYSSPVDMWALGTIMAELVNLRPLFPGKKEADQLYLITQVLGDPCETYSDERGKQIGGGKWEGGVQMARDNFGFTFQKILPKDLVSLFDPSVPPRLIECIADLLKYDPSSRLTSLGCLEHPYVLDAIEMSHSNIPPALFTSSSLSGHSTPISQSTGSPATSYPNAQSLPNLQGELESIQASLRRHISKEYTPPNLPMNTVVSPIGQEFPDWPHFRHDNVSAPASKSYKTPSIPLRKQRRSVFRGISGDGDKSRLPPVDEIQNTSHKRAQSSSTDNLSLEVPALEYSKKEALRMAREAERQQRILRAKTQREISRAVMLNRKNIFDEAQNPQELAWKWQSHPKPVDSQGTSRLVSSDKLYNSGGPIRDRHAHGNAVLSLGLTDRVEKARRREFDDDHSMSSSGYYSSSAMSVTSLSTTDSDSVPLQTPPVVFGFLPETSSSSLGHLDDDHSSASDQTAGRPLLQTSMDPNSLSDLALFPPIHALSLSSAGSWPPLPQGGGGTDEKPQQSRPSHLSRKLSSNEDGLSPGLGLTVPVSAINPIFTAPSRPSSERSPSKPALPPFSYLQALAHGEDPPSPTFSTPDIEY